MVGNIVGLWPEICGPMVRDMVGLWPDISCGPTVQDMVGLWPELCGPMVRDMEQSMTQKYQNRLYCQDTSFYRKKA